MSFPKITRKIEKDQETVKIQFLTESSELILDRNKCVGCGKCVKVCPYEAIDMEDKLAVINDKCTICAICIDSCPFEAILLTKDTAGTENIEDYSGICVYAEHREGHSQLAP